MNIFLVPHTWARHVAVGLVVGGAAVMAWWVFLATLLKLGPSLFRMGLLWRPGFEGPFFLVFVATVIGATSVLVEANLRRERVLLRLGKSLAAGVATLLFAALLLGMAYCVRPIFVSATMDPLLADPSLVSLRYTIPLWLAAALASTLGPLAVRRGADGLTHVLAGLLCGFVAAGVWQYLGNHLAHDLYLAGALSAFAWGLTHGLFAWGVPSDLYAGWVRVLSERRYGYRIPVDRRDGQPSERFIGHFPRGLDLYLPVEDGVAELHTSFVVDANHRYTVRGLSQWPTVVKRFLERVDLRYNPRSPAPLETELSSGDMVLLTDGRHETWVEFVLLPKEEQ